MVYMNIQGHDDSSAYNNVNMLHNKNQTAKMKMVKCLLPSLNRSYLNELRLRLSLSLSFPFPADSVCYVGYSVLVCVCVGGVSVSVVFVFLVVFVLVLVLTCVCVTKYGRQASMDVLW